MKFSNEENKDKFYTKSDVAEKLIKMIDLDAYTQIIEPSAGSGAFSQYMPKRATMMDLHPEGEGIIEQDWFAYNHVKRGRLAVVGNPPFGDRNVLAKKFIEKSIEIGADLIAFVLTDTFRKPTYQDVATGYKLTKIIQLKDNSFTLQGEDYHVPCSMYIWEKLTDSIDLTWRKGTYVTNDFTFIKQSEFTDGDIAIKQAISKQMINPEKGKCYYIRPSLGLYNKVINTLSNISYRGYSAVNGGVIALGQEEIVRNYLQGELL